MKIAVGLATIILLAGCASGQGVPPTFKNNTDDTLIYCETIGGGHKECRRMQKGEAVNRVNQFLNSPRARF